MQLIWEMTDKQYYPILFTYFTMFANVKSTHQNKLHVSPMLPFYIAIIKNSQSLVVYFKNIDGSWKF